MIGVALFVPDLVAAACSGALNGVVLSFSTSETIPVITFKIGNIGLNQVNQTCRSSVLILRVCRQQSIALLACPKNL